VQPRAAAQAAAQPAVAERAQPQPQPTAQPAAAAPAASVSDMETSIPLARLVELDVGNNDVHATKPPARNQTFGVS
jgi:hypothetical protein